VIASPLPRADSPRELGFDAARLEHLRDLLQADIARGVIAGVVVLVARHGRIAWQASLGLEDGADAARPMQPHTLFRIAAMTRPVVAAAAMSLVEDGLLSLADPVAHYLPELGALKVGVEEVDASGKPRLVLQAPRRAMTVHDLLRHTAGFTYGMFGDSLVQRMYREAAPMEPGQTNAEMVRKLADLPLQCHPGSTFEYGMSTDVLGRVLEVASGQDLDRFVAERITGPLGMAHTGFRVSPQAGAGLARARGEPGSPRAVLFDYDPSRPPTWCSGGAGLLSTAGDYARFCQMLLEGGELGGKRLLSRKSVELMLRDHLPPGIAYGTSTAALGINAPTPELGQGHGLGVGLRCQPGLLPVAGSVGDFFWGGVLGTYFWADPREQLVAVLMLQENDIAVRGRYRALLRNMVYGALVDRAPL
jgi:CubicO group peptidase (beta-lactamase class C family)